MTVLRRIACTLACTGALLSTASAAAPRPLPPNGAKVFANHDFGALNLGAMNTVAVPWKLVAAALVLDDPEDGEVSMAHLRRRLSAFGFLWPDAVLGSDVPVSISASRPLGLNVGEATPGLPPVKVTVANLGCASCHAGPSYAADGAPRPDRPWLGSPNTSLDLEAYTRAATRALRHGLADEPRLLAAVQTLFPETSWWETISLRLVVIPLARHRLAAVGVADTPLPFENGSPGVTNGVAALKLQGRTVRDPVEVGFTSIPDLADRSFRSALLYDGAYAPAGGARWRAIRREDRTAGHRRALAAITSFFTVPSMGLSPTEARRQIAAAELTMEWLDERRPQTFPGEIDPVQAARGAAIYARHCASCHGDYSAEAVGPHLERFPNWHGRVGSDPARAAAFSGALSRYVAEGPYGRVIQAAPTGEYAATLLSGVWATAPYLHNGSVPTLAQLLLLEPRAERFEVGGHRLDFRAVGIAGADDGAGVRRYPAGYVAWSRPAVFDTGKPGRSNRGHEAEFEALTVSERWDVIEYLKGL